MTNRWGYLVFEVLSRGIGPTFYALAQEMENKMLQALSNWSGLYKHFRINYGVLPDRAA